MNIGDIITDGLVRGRVIGEGLLTKRKWPVYKIEILTGPEKGKISVIDKNDAVLVATKN